MPAIMMRLCCAALGVAAGRPAVRVNAEPGECILSIMKALICATACCVISGPPLAGCQIMRCMHRQVRHGQGDQAVELLARECGRPLPDVAGVRPTQLFARYLLAARCLPSMPSSATVKV
jgi:hypothetical protein